SGRACSINPCYARRHRSRLPRSPPMTSDQDRAAPAQQPVAEFDTGAGCEMPRTCRDHKYCLGHCKTAAPSSEPELRAEIERLDAECQQFMLDICRERERAEAAEARVTALEKGL